MGAQLVLWPALSRRIRAASLPAFSDARREREFDALRCGVTLIEVVVAVAILAVIAAIILSSDLLVSPNDRERYDAAADALAKLTQAIVGSDPTNPQTSFKWVINRYPRKLSQLTTPITTAGTTICGNTYSAGNVSKWLNPFWPQELRTTGTIIAPGFTVQDNLGAFPDAGLGYFNGTTGVLQATPTGGGQRTDGIISIRMPATLLADAQGLDLAVDGTLNGAAGIVRYAATDPTSVDYYIMVSGC